MECLIPIIDVKTRWNSTYDMLVRAINIKDNISDTIYSYKDNSLIALLLDEQDWGCILQLVQVLQPLKEVTLLTSQSSDSLCIVKVLPLYDYCTDTLSESMKNFDKSNDIYVGLEAAVDKLNHYYDSVSPMVGIALMLTPTMKKEYLQDSLNWEQEWVDTATGHFVSAFKYYKQKVDLSAAVPVIRSPIQTVTADGYKNYLKRKRNTSIQSNMENEYVRFKLCDLIVDILMHQF